MADPKDIKKSVEETVNQILSADKASAANGGTTQPIVDPTAAPAGDVTKAMPTSTPANGGDDKIKSGSPLTEEQKAEEAKKAQAAADAKKAEEEAVAKAKEDSDKNGKEKDKDKDKDDKSKMKKSLEELKEVLDEEEFELVRTWREECEKEAVAKSQAAAQPANPLAGIEEMLKKAVTEGTADLRKALSDKDDLIKGLNEKIEKMSNQPAYDRRSISTLETIEKSGASGTGELKKSQVLDKMLELQAAGKGVTSHHIAEFEATNNISDPTVRGTVFRELKLN